MDRVAVVGDRGRVMNMALQIAQTSIPSPSAIFQAPASDPIQAVGASVAIILALAAAVLGYRIIRGGRGL